MAGIGGPNRSATLSGQREPDVVRVTYAQADPSLWTFSPHSSLRWSEEQLVAITLFGATIATAAILGSFFNS
jgi:hypothetical protein